MFKFEKLGVWQKSVEFGNLVYEATKAFPRSEVYGLTSQTRRAATSISANLAEGSSRTSGKDFSRFVEIAYGSLCETVSHLRISRLQGYLDEQQLRALYDDAENLGRMLTAFRNTLGDWKAK